MKGTVFGWFVSLPPFYSCVGASYIVVYICVCTSTPFFFVLYSNAVRCTDWNPFCQIFRIHYVFIFLFFFFVWLVLLTELVLAVWRNENDTTKVKYWWAINMLLVFRSCFCLVFCFMMPVRFHHSVTQETNHKSEKR